MKYTKIKDFAYKKIFRPALFSLDPEFVHDSAVRTGQLISKNEYFLKKIHNFYAYEDNFLNQELAGIEFRNPLGLSAGFDKDGKIIKAVEAFGFGFTQVGTVTLNPYKGNPRPRLKRLKNSKAIFVNYGLKSEGVRKVAKRVRKTSSSIPVSVSVGKTNAAYTASVGAGIKDYVDCIKYLQKHCNASMYTINISCPNTYGGEPFTDPEKFLQLSLAIKKLKLTKPVFVKMPINLAWQDFRSLLDIAIEHKIQGVVIGNLNKDKKKNIKGDKVPDTDMGGISGKPTYDLSNTLIQKTFKHSRGRLKIIGVGGIFSAEDAYQKIKLGANLLQIITGMIYEGPTLPGKINLGLAELAKAEGYKRISEAVGKGTN